MTSTNLPLQLTTFIGRERDLAALEQLLSTARLVTLTGVGGSGKTRLAVQVARQVGENFPDGVFFVDLVPLHEPELVPQLVLETLGLRITPDQPVLEALLNFLHHKQLLIVLDNCEHLISACTSLAQALLPSDDLRILATSREPLGIAGERIYPLSGLALPEAGRAAEAVPGNLDSQSFLHYDAVRLFVERARLFSPDFSLTFENTPAVAEICRRLDGLPLALELASARANVLTAQEISARLDDRFALLTSGKRSGLQPRHQALRATIDWSYALLTAEEQTLLRRLAVFTAGCSLDTAEAVCSGEGIEAGRMLDLLSSLVDKSIVISETTGRAQARYRLLETIREYALEKLDESGETEFLRNRHLQLFLARAEEAAPKLGDAYQQLWLSWLEGEHDNLRAAMTWALESDQIEAGLRIANALPRFWEIRGHVPEGMAWLERLLARADESISLDVRVNAFTYASHMAMFLDDSTASTAYARQAVALAESAGEEGNPLLLMALAGLSSSVQAAGDYQNSFAIGERSLQLLRKTPLPPFLSGMFYLGTGNVAVEAGYFARARELLSEGLRMAREAGDAYRVAHSFTSLGNLARYEGNYAEARAAYEKSVALLREVDARHDLAAIIRSQGQTCLLLEDVERAYELFNESMALHQAEQNTAGIAECLIGLGSTAVVRGMPAAGAHLLSAGAAIREQRSGFTWPAKPLETEPYLALARAQIGEAEFQAEAAAGRAMSLEQAIKYAQNLSLKPEAPFVRNEKMAELTGREREVALLIARGYSNREIATELVISTRTVEKHVANILSKLGMSSRSQIVLWAIENGLRPVSE